MIFYSYYFQIYLFFLLIFIWRLGRFFNNGLNHNLIKRSLILKPSFTICFSIVCWEQIS